MTTVLVTGVGALIGQGILQALNQYRDQRDISIIGTDLNAQTHATHLCTEFVQKPSFDEDSSEYLSFWQQTIAHFNIDIILPGIENDVIFLNRPECKDLRFPSLINSPETLSIGLDKYVLSSFTNEHNLLSIPTALTSNNEFVQNLIDNQTRCIVKPRKSNGSRGIYKFNSGDQLYLFLQEIPQNELDNLIVQPHIGSDSQEFTASIFGFGDGRYQGPIVFRRLLAKDGYTKYVQTVVPPNDITNSIQKIASVCKPVGPTNFQYRALNDRYYLMEINPRFSSTTSLKAAFGFDETIMSLDFFLEGISSFELEIQQGEAWRYISDFVKLS